MSLSRRAGPRASWIRRLTGHKTPELAPFRDDIGSDDDPEQLRSAVRDVVRYVNRHAGRLPAAAVVNARRITDTLAETVDSSNVRPLDVHAVIAIRAIATDYLPTTVGRFLAIDPGLRDSVRASGSRADQSLMIQLETLQRAAEDTLASVRDQDADALATQERFLRSKMSRSDLDL